ncbi:MAG: UDP-glucose 4-epimerase GalE [Planctomycetales bacterium]|nr:UDP-glucose 4-epimerase GalE [Planctomycetales bacterium]
MNLLVAGGAGYVGSAVARRLSTSGHRVVVVDDLSAGHAEAVDGIRGIRLLRADLAAPGLDRALAAAGPVEAVLHFAGKIAVGESFADPEGYRRANVTGSEALLAWARAAGVRRFVFSSSAGVYGTPEKVPVPESAPLRPVSPYGETKVAVEERLAGAAKEWGLGAVALRYFNASGATDGGRHGEDHRPETHLIPRLLAAAASGSAVPIYGTDGPTPDGTCVRDYVHIEDLVEAHVRALDAVRPGEVRAFNVGAGSGASVREVIAAAERVTGRTVRTKDEPPRRGDPPSLVADISLAARELAWKPTRGLEEILASAWSWHRGRPGGYSGRRG